MTALQRSTRRHKHARQRVRPRRVSIKRTAELKPGKFSEPQIQDDIVSHLLEHRTYFVFCIQHTGKWKLGHTETRMSPVRVPQSNDVPIHDVQTEDVLPNSPHAAASTDLSDGGSSNYTSPSQTLNESVNGALTGALAVSDWRSEDEDAMQLQLEDGTVYQGWGFGSKKSIAGELVFQTGMVGYPESITDPSYRGQILVITFPLVGNYGVPSRDTLDGILRDLPAHFEASQIHVSGLVVASYSGEDYSHYLATSSLGTWLREQGVPAMYGVDTRALTKRIREGGSMLGKMVVEVQQTNGMANEHSGRDGHIARRMYEHIDWFNPNVKNLVADGEGIPPATQQLGRVLTFCVSLGSRASSLHSTQGDRFVSSFWTSCQSHMR